MPVPQQIRLFSRGPSAVRRTMARFAAQVLTPKGKNDCVSAKASDAFPWDEVSDASTAEGDAVSWSSGDSLARISEISGISEASHPCTVPCGPDEPVVIFDYDDTLLPTSFFDRLGTLPSVGAQLEDAEKHARQVERMLRTARSHGRVAIVTMANRRWLVKSARRYLPGLDIEALAVELDIPLVFASEHSARFAHLPSFDAAVACKSAAIASCLEELEVVEAAVRKPVNVVSVGDSYIEHNALRSVLATWGEAGRLDVAPALKTVKFLHSPTLTQLSEELRHLEARLGGIVQCTSDFHLVATSCSEFEQQQWEGGDDTFLH